MKKLTKEQTKEYQKKRTKIYQKIGELRRYGPSSGPAYSAAIKDYREALTKLTVEYFGKDFGYDDDEVSQSTPRPRNR